MRSARSLVCMFAVTLASFASTSARAQQWTGIIAPTRAADWTSSGVVGGIPSASWSNCSTTACSTLLSGSVTATTIQNALASAPANTVVRIPAGTFSVGAFDITKSNVVLRGAGADQTRLNATGCNSGGGLGGTNCPFIHIMSGATGVGSFGGVTSANWTGTNGVAGTYTQGATVLTLSSTTGLVAGPVGTGSMIFLDQNDDTSGTGYPTANDVIQCAENGSWCSNQGGNNYARAGRAQVQAVTVTAINGSSVTVTPGVAYPNFRTSQSPGAYWNTGSPVSNVGIEDMTVDFTNDGGQGIYILNAANFWVKGTRIVNTATGTQETYHIFMLQDVHGTVRSNYVYGRPTTCSPFPLANYAITNNEVSDTVVENNILQANTEGLVPNDPEGRNVYAYNFAVNSTVGIAGIQFHSGNIMYDLVEGNDFQNIMGDVTHGSHNFLTFYRNLFDGTANNNACSASWAFEDLTNNRFFQAIANVIGNSSYTPYEADLGSGGSNEEFGLGWQGNNSGTTVNNDTNVKRTFLRWGNWDMLSSTNRTGTNDQTGIRFCGSALNTGWATTCGSTSEVPSLISAFANPLPTLGDLVAGQSAMPASFYLTSKPSWFGSVPFPAIGPDVSNGNAPNTTTTPSGGHANLIPAHACFNGLSNDPAYSGSNPPVKTFNAATCYGGGSVTLPAPPTGLAAAVQP